MTNVESGDILLYSGTHPLHVRQHKLTGCSWAQVGLALFLPEISAMCVFEATKLSECKDVQTGRILRGVQLVLLEERVSSYEGSIAVRHLVPPLPREKSRALIAFAREVHSLPFNDSKWVAVRAYHRRNTLQPGGAFFCSELVAEALQRIDLVARPPRGPTSNNYIPADFAGAYPKSILELRQGFALTQERILKAGAGPSPGSPRRQA